MVEAFTAIQYTGVWFRTYLVALPLILCLERTRLVSCLHLQFEHQQGNACTAELGARPPFWNAANVYECQFCRA